MGCAAWDTESYAFRRLTVTLGCAHTPSECMLTILMARSQPSMLKPRRCTWSFPVDIAITESISNPSPPGIDKVLFVASPDLRTKLASVTDSVVRDTESYRYPTTFVM